MVHEVCVTPACKLNQKACRILSWMVCGRRVLCIYWIIHSFIHAFIGSFPHPQMLSPDCYWLLNEMLQQPPCYRMWLPPWAQRADTSTEELNEQVDHHSALCHALMCVLPGEKGILDWTLQAVCSKSSAILKTLYHTLPSHPNSTTCAPVILWRAFPPQAKITCLEDTMKSFSPSFEVTIPAKWRTLCFCYTLPGRTKAPES